jgi:hypothetical protein
MSWIVDIDRLPDNTLGCKDECVGQLIFAMAANMSVYA